MFDPHSVLTNKDKLKQLRKKNTRKRQAVDMDRQDTKRKRDEKKETNTKK